MNTQKFDILLLEDDKMERENAWLKYTEEDVVKLNNICDDYKNFLNVAKTEREATKEIIRRAEQKGYQDLEEYIKNNKRILPGDKIYVNNKGKAVALFNIGTKPITEE